MTADIASGHVDLADVLLLIAGIVFALGAIAGYVRQAVPRDWLPVLVPLGLTLVAVALLVL